MKKFLPSAYLTRDKKRNDGRAKHSPLLLMLMALAMMMIAPQRAIAETVTTTYDFKASIDAGNTTVSMGEADATYTNCNYFTQIGNVSNPGRFAAQGSWILTEGGKRGLYNYNGGGRRFIVSNLYAGDIVTFDILDNNGNSQTISLESTSTATASGNTFTMTTKGMLVVNVTRYWSIKTITIQHERAAAWGYDPAPETYDCYWINSNIQSNFLKPAGFPLDVNDLEAQFLTNLADGTALNDRIAISQVTWNENTLTPWQLTYQNGLISQWAYHNMSICNLVEGDRVVIYYTTGRDNDNNDTGLKPKFSSKAENWAYNGCSAFKDIENNGDFDEGDDAYITCGMELESVSQAGDMYTSYPYVITEDGHLDIAIPAGAVIRKIQIFGDHQARMVDRDNEHDTNTSYFDTTGELEAKHHIVPGGLHVYVGNDDLTQHAEVVMSDKGPVSFVYDQNHFKMARQPSWGGVNVGDALPVTGTFYKFVPDVSGHMWVKFKAANLTYNDYGQPGNGAYDVYGTANEKTMNVNCPYYLMVEENGSFHQVENPHYYSNGADGYFGKNNGNPGEGPDKEGIHLERDKTYYLYGWWQDGTDASHLQDFACGVAELLEVTFKPDQIVTPLAKWVESGTTTDNNLATVRGYAGPANPNPVFVKKKSSNIASCTPYIEGEKLKIKDITFVDENKGGGTILIKIGDKNRDADPVFVYTIAYNAGYNPTILGQDEEGNNITRSEGHTWNFSENPLKALQWTDKSTEAEVVDFGTHFDNFATASKDDNGIPTNGVKSGLLTDEIDKGDWTFNYRVKKNGQFHDPRFLNNYDMEGDNADMMWDTEGIIINAGSSQSCIFDEFSLTSNRVIDHSNKTQDDPDRYVGFLEGGEFIIPHLKKDDRVIVYMGSGNGSGQQAMEFHITNARDALYNEIDPNDIYHAGGSQWNVPNGHNDPNYRGCYHFYALDDGDMKFQMSGGSMCKLYSIKIYRGEREETNAIQETGNGYTIFASKAQNGTVTTGTNTWNLHYRGKGETLADGTGKFTQENEVIAHSGNISNLTIDNPNNTTISYTNQGEIGMLRARVKCMEYNHNYVTDFSDRNFTLALHETQSYPYTWDFTDIDVYSGSDISAEDSNYPETDISYDVKGYDLSMWDEEGNMIIYGPTWGYTNQNMIFENCKGINGNQLYANGKVIPETQGLWFYFDNNDAAYNGSMQITEDGLRLANTKKGNNMGWWNYKMVVPSVPANGAVYLRLARDPSVSEEDYSQKPGEDPVYFFTKKFQFEHMNTKADIGTELTNVCKYYQVKDVNPNAPASEKEDYIVAIRNTGEQSNLTLTLNGWIIKKMSVSVDEKKIGGTGYATESRDRVIDHRLTGFFTGKNIEAYIGKMNEDHTHLNMTQIDIMDLDTDPNNPADASHIGKGCILYNNAGDGVTDKSVKVFDDGTFHLFVPDMHLKDEASTRNTTGNSGSYSFTTNFTSDNDLKACVPAIDPMDATTSTVTRYILSARPYQENGGSRPTTEDGKLIGFYRVNPKTGAHMQGHQAYLEVPNSAAGARVDIFFDFEDIDDGVATKVEGVENEDANGSYVTISGQRVNNPTKSGLYIKNGKKIVVK